MSRLAPIAERAAAPATLDLPPSDLGLAWRPLTPADVPELTVLVQAQEEGDGLPFRTVEDEVAEYFDSASLDPEHDTVVGVDGEGTMRAYCFVMTYAGDTSLVRALHLGGVHPQWRRRGVGTALVAWANGRARQLLATSGNEVPGRIAVYLDESQQGAERLFLAAGYTPIRYFSELKRPLDDTLGAHAPGDGVRIEAWPDDDEPVRLTHNEAFADHWGSQPRSVEDWSNYRSMFAKQWSFVAVDEATGQVVGYVETGKYEQDWELSGYSSGYISLLGVLRSWRGRGIAKALLAATMVAQRADGIEYAEIGVDTANPSGAHGLYAALGFVPFRSETMLSIEI